MSVWKPCNHDDFTGSEIITKPKVYVVLQYTRKRWQVSHMLKLEDRGSTQKDGAAKINTSVFLMKRLLNGENCETT